jgi:cytochrome c-type biogenesis protein CcmH
MLVFWIAAALLSAAAVAVVMARAGRSDPQAAETPELIVYRRHLSELDQLRAQGLIDETHHAEARAEAARRLLSAKTTAETTPAKPRDPRRDRTVVLLAAAATVTVGAGIYLLVGSPGLGDQPYQGRLNGWLTAVKVDPGSLGPGELAAILKQASVRKPRDPQVWSFLGREYTEAGDPADAVGAYEKAVSLDPNRAGDWAGLGSSLVKLNDGQIGPDAQHALAQALRLDPSQPGPRFLLGQAAIEAGHKEEGLAAWRTLAQSWSKDDPRRATLEAKIAAVETGQPDAAQAVAQAAPAQQTDMIKGMVAGLAAKLKDHPDDPDGWARLVRSYGVLGDRPSQTQALAHARTLFKNRPQDLAKVEAAATVP